MKAEDAGSNNYWLPYFFVAENSPQLARNLDNWFQQYSFARNVATAFYIAFAYLAVSVGISLNLHQLKPISTTGITCLLGMAGLFFVLSFVMLVRYYYLYATYYSKALFRSFVYLNLRGTPATKLLQTNRSPRVSDDDSNASI